MTDTMRRLWSPTIRKHLNLGLTMIAFVELWLVGIFSNQPATHLVKPQPNPPAVPIVVQPIPQPAPIVAPAQARPQPHQTASHQTPVTHKMMVKPAPHPQATHHAPTARSTTLARRLPVKTKASRQHTPTTSRAVVMRRAGEARRPSNAPYDSLELALGSDAVRASNALIAENEGRAPISRRSMAQELGVTPSQYRTILKKNLDLKRRLKVADARGAQGTRRLLLNDHEAWLREYLGPVKYQRYLELNRRMASN